MSSAPLVIVKQVLFRFAFVYLALFNLPRLLSFVIPGVKIDKHYVELWTPLVRMVGEQVFHVRTNIGLFPPMDSISQFVLVFCYLVLAAAVAIVWTVRDWNKPSDPRHYEWLRLNLRFAVGCAMISYGALKIINLQFPEPSLDRLVQPVGDVAPEGILWTFMGSSQSYSVFSGVAEMIGGLLLSARRTTSLGALICLGVLSNVVMMNYCYDIPVKLYSTHLLVMSLILVGYDIRRLSRLLLFNRSTAPVELPALLEQKRSQDAAIVLRTVFVVVFTLVSFYYAYDGRRVINSHEDGAPKSPLYGIWNVEEFEQDGQVRPPLVTDLDRWRRVIFDYPHMLAIQDMSDSRHLYRLRLDIANKRLLMSPFQGPAQNSAFSYQQPDPGILIIEGTFDGRKVRAKLRRVEDPKFLLTSHKFRWIKEDTTPAPLR